LVDVEDVFLGSCEYAVRVVGLASFLLHYYVSNLVLKILKHDKIWGQFSLASPLQILADCSSRTFPWCTPTLGTKQFNSWSGITVYRISRL